MLNIEQKKVFILDGLRSPFVRAGKEFKNLHPCCLATYNIKEFLYKMNFQGDEFEEVILGNSFILPDSSNIARIASLRAGLPQSLSATTTLRNCASSMESFATAVAKIQAGFYSSALVGGVESMSQAPLLFKEKLIQSLQRFLQSKNLKQKLKSFSSLKLRDLKPRLALVEGLTDPTTGYSMGETAELLAREFDISKEEQDKFAVSSHQKAVKAETLLQEELFHVVTESQVINKDKGPKKLLLQKRLSQIKPYFDRKYGTITIGNSCPINDGSSLLSIMSEEKLKSLGRKAMVFVRSICWAGLEPKRMGLGPVYASALALKKAGLELKDIGLIEINEAFAAQVLSCMKAFASKSFCEQKLGLQKALGEIDPEKLNVNGGAIAIGHPISATGTRLILTLAKEMQRRDIQFGLASLCIGGGQGGAVILEKAAG